MKSSVKGLRMSKDSKGVVFDLLSDLSDVVKVCSSDIFKQCVCVGGGVWMWVCNLLATKVFIGKLLLQDECRWSYSSPVMKRGSWANKSFPRCCISCTPILTTLCVHVCVCDISHRMFAKRFSCFVSFI